MICPDPVTGCLQEAAETKKAAPHDGAAHNIISDRITFA
jgi:hypothetical protein